MTLKNNRAPLLSSIKLCASFRRHVWIQTGVTVRKWLNGVMTSVTLTFDLWPWPFAWTSLLSLVITPENFMMIPWWEHSQKGVTDRRTDWTIHRAAWSQLKILKQGKSEGFESCERPIVGKCPIWVKLGDVSSHVTLKFDGWPWKTIGHLSFAVSSFVQHFIAIFTGEFKLEVKVRKRKIGAKFNDFFIRVTLKFDRWHWKTIGHLFYATSRFMHHFVAIGEWKLELQSGNAQFGSNSTIFRAVWP